MMAVTHALMGLLIGISGLWFLPELAIYAALGAFAGGVFPDLDLIHNHRRTLHYPVIYSVMAVTSLGIVALDPTIYTVFTSYFLVSAAVHSVIDVFGGGLETRPWIPSDDRAVYSHTLGKWFEPRRWIRYDGSPEDLAFSTLLAVPCYIMYGSPLKELVLLTLTAGAVYTVLRKKIVEWAPERFL